MPAPLVPLTGDLRLSDAGPLARQLGAALASGDLAIDATGLGSADAAVVQVLAAAARQAGQAGRQFRLTLPPDGPVAALVGRMALDGILAPQGATGSTRSETEK